MDAKVDRGLVESVDDIVENAEPLAMSEKGGVEWGGHVDEGRSGLKS